MNSWSEKEPAPNLETIEKQLVKKCKSENRLHMGIPAEVANPQAVFARQFRWVAVPTNEDIQYFFTHFVPDFATKTFEAQVMEDPLMAEKGEVTGGGKVHAWIEKLLRDNLYRKPDENIRINFYDGCGSWLYALDFKGLSLVSHKMPLDYSKGDIVKHTLVFDYQEMERITAQ
jgi:hypothetical protein